MNLPDGVIDSPELFMEGIRLSHAHPEGEDIEREAIVVLEDIFRDRMRSIDSSWQDNERHYKMVFWTGALLGNQVAFKGYQRRLQQMAAEHAMESGTATARVVPPIERPK